MGFFVGRCRSAGRGISILRATTKFTIQLTFLFGAVAEARSSIGWVVFGGLGIAAVFTLYLTPAIYLLLARYASSRAAEAKQLADELEHAELQA